MTFFKIKSNEPPSYERTKKQIHGNQFIFFYHIFHTNTDLSFDSKRTVETDDIRRITLMQNLRRKIGFLQEVSFIDDYF